MVPDTFVRMERMLLTTTGRLNRSELPDSDKSEKPGRTNWNPPRTETERMLVDIWQSILRHDGISISDDLFTAGGHSLEVTKLISTMQEKFGVEVPLALIFEPASIRHVGQYILHV